MVAGLTLTMMLFGWPVGATIAARGFKRFGLRPTMILGSVLLPIGATVFVVLTADSSPILAAFGSLVMGFGMGLISISSLVLIQEIVQRSQRGSATASNIFARNLGSTLGATVLGAALNYGLNSGGHDAPVSSDQLRRLIEGGATASNDLHGIGLLLNQSLHLTFWAMLAISLGAALFAVFVPAIKIKSAADMAAHAEVDLST